jgi:hypothetical protein
MKRERADRMCSGPTEGEMRLVEDKIAMFSRANPPGVSEPRSQATPIASFGLVDHP